MILGGLLAVAAMKVWRWRRWGGGCGGGWHHGGRHRHGHGAWGMPDPEGDAWGPRFPGMGRRQGMSFAVRFLSDRLDATPAQERSISEALEELRAEVEPLREEGKKTRADLAAALRKPDLDEVLFGELFARQDGVLEKARKAFMGAVGKVHASLDDKQREHLAELVERGPRFFRYGRPW
jgi:hypothetical protein